jgi:hypothetical protein
MHIEQYLVSNVVNPQVYTSLHFTALQLHFTSPTINTLHGTPRCNPLGNLFQAFAVGLAAVAQSV